MQLKIWANIFREAFKIFDRNRDGFIDMKELKKVTAMLGTMLSQEEIEEFMAEADKDGNGKIDYEEFVKMLMSYWNMKVFSSCICKMHYVKLKYFNIYDGISDCRRNLSFNIFCVLWNGFGRK